MEERLQKILSRAGITSRRKAEKLIIEGKVKVNGKIVKELGVKADIEKDKIEVNGEVISIPKAIYVILYKPPYYLTTMYDPKGRKKVTDLIKNIPYRIFPVGRLDYDAEGLLLMTNDGKFANLITHPRYRISKTYLVKIEGNPSKKIIEEMKKGVEIGKGKAHISYVKLIYKREKTSLIEIIIKEGRYREIKRIFEKIGHPVIRIKRIAIGPLKIGKLKPGEYRFLTHEEVKKILSSVQKNAYL